MYINRLLVFLPLALSILGCDQILGETTTIRFKATGPVLKTDEAIIIARLREHTSTLSPTHTFSAANGEAVITVKGAPNEVPLHFLLEHRGLFQARSENGRPWFTQSDIVDAVAGFDDQKRTVLNLHLSPEGTTRVAGLSANATGELIVVELDGEKLTSARVSGPIPQGRIQLTLGKSPEEALLISTILKTGALSFTPASVTSQRLK
jgi:preprotein translocase subunit SecD